MQASINKTWQFWAQFVFQDCIAYVSLYFLKFLPSCPTPINSLVKEGQSILVHHITWLYFLRERIWSRIKYEEEMIPSDGALQRYWQRLCWVLRKKRKPSLENISYNIATNFAPSRGHCSHDVITFAHYVTK